MTYAKVIEDSIYHGGTRLTTFEVRCHRFVLAEFNTHRVFSRNSASSRAIPVGGQLDRFLRETAYPVEWSSEQKGMQGGPALEGNALGDAEELWDNLVASTHDLVHDYLISHPLDDGPRLHKSLLNRWLEPGQWHTIVVTATAWENFFTQRCSPLAQPEIRAAAEAMKAAYDASTPAVLEEGQWHMPYLDADTIVEVTSAEPDALPFLRNISVARCARVSYLTQGGVRDYHEDLELYRRLVTARPMHASPLEHVATPWPWNEQTLTFKLPLEWPMKTITRTVPKLGNLLGWRQHRLEIEGFSEIESFV